MCAYASLAQPGEGIGGEAPARVARGDRRLRALDPSLRRRARLRGKLRQFRKPPGNIAARNFCLAAGKNRGRVAARRLVDAADADQFFRVHRELAEHALARCGGGLTRRRKARELARQRRSRGHAGSRERLERGNEFWIAAERLHGGELGRKGLPALDRAVERVRGEREPHRTIAALRRLLAALDRRHAVPQGFKLAAHGGGRIGNFLRKLGERRGAGVGPRARLARGGKGLLAAAAERARDLDDRLELSLERG